MAIDFKSSENAAVDALSGITISYPRVLPSTRPDGSDGVEYQFSIRKGDERIDGLGVFGTEDVTGVSGQREWVYTIDLSSESALRSILRVKESIGSKDDDITFLIALARGLVNVFAGQDGNTDNLSYVAFTSVEALSALDTAVPVGARVMAKEAVVLAEVHVPADRAVTNRGSNHAP